MTDLQELNRFEHVTFPFEAVKVAKLERTLRVIRTDNPQTLWPIYHAGPLGCGCVAFFSTRRWVAHVDEVSAEEAVNVDGQHPDQHVQITCGSCRAPVSTDELEYADGV